MPKYIVVLEVESFSDPENWDWNINSNAFIDVVCSKEMK